MKAQTNENRENQKPTSLLSYLKSIQALWFRVVFLATFSTPIIVFLFPSVFPFNIARWGLAVIMIFLLPGYVLAKLLFPKQISQQQSGKYFEPLERVALSIGLSMAVVPIIGLLLNYAPGGINLASILLTLTALLLFLSLIALLAEYRSIKEFSNQDEGASS